MVRIPERSCIGCRKKSGKNAFLRIVRMPDGEFRIDRKGTLAGRGAYLCENKDCLQTAVRHRSLDRSFRTKVPDDFYRTLSEAFGQD